MYVLEAKGCNGETIMIIREKVINRPYSIRSDGKNGAIEPKSP